MLKNSSLLNLENQKPFHQKVFAIQIVAEKSTFKFFIRLFGNQVFIPQKLQTIWSVIILFEIDAERKMTKVGIEK